MDAPLSPSEQYLRSQGWLPSQNAFKEDLMRRMRSDAEARGLVRPSVSTHTKEDGRIVEATLFHYVRERVDGMLKDVRKEETVDVPY